MKGPGLRSKLDVRRIWKCPRTGRILKTPGSITQLVSPFSQEPCWMQYVETQRVSRHQATFEEMRSHMTVECSDLQDEVSAPPEIDNSEVKSPSAEAVAASEPVEPALQENIAEEESPEQQGDA